MGIKDSEYPMENKGLVIPMSEYPVGVLLRPLRNLPESIRGSRYYPEKMFIFHIL